MMSKFNFISDDDFRNTLENDYSEIENCHKANAWKAVLVLSGSIIECLLSDYLISLDDKKFTKENVIKFQFSELITTCLKEKIITEKASKLSDVVRDFRNLIHPGRLIRTQTFPNKDDANIALSLVEIIIKEISEKKHLTYGYTAEQILYKIETHTSSKIIWPDLINKLNNYEKTKLIVELLPSRYFELCNDEFTNYEATLDLFSQFFILLFNSANDDIKKKLANEFCRIVKEEYEFKVITHIKVFFHLSYLEFLSADDQRMIVKLVLSEFGNGRLPNFAWSLQGIDAYLNSSNLHIFIKKFIISVISDDNDIISQWKYKDFLGRTFIKFDNDLKDRTLGMIESFGERMTEKNKEILENFRNFLLNYSEDDLPF